MIPEFPIDRLAAVDTTTHSTAWWCRYSGSGHCVRFDRIVEAVKEMKFISAKNISAKVLVTVFDESTQLYSAQIAASLRKMISRRALPCS